MGIRGLTTFVSQYADKLFQPHQIHDSYLVLDGNNICCQLYIWHTKAFDCFGGDYDNFARVVTSFFEALRKCRITPIVVFDGNYERKKTRTIFTRMRDRLKAAGALTPATEGRAKVFPLFNRGLFADIANKLGVSVFRCELEADNEMACLARALACPVLSYDSDFYIFDVLYIPFNTLDLTPRYSRQNLTWCLNCELFQSESLLRSFPGLSREHLPLIATLLGNDYIKASVFSNFYSHLKLVRTKSTASLQQRRIKTVFNWLKTETFQSAVTKILNRLKIIDRKSVANQIDMNVKAYVCSDSVVLKTLNISHVPDQSPRLDIKCNLFELVDGCENYEETLTDIEMHSSDESSQHDPDTEIKQHNLLLDTEIDLAISRNDNIPEWFLRKHNLCYYPSTIYEIAQGIIFFFTPQLEDYNDKPSHSVCFRILSGINKIISQGLRGCERPLTCVGRNDSNGVHKFKMDLYPDDIISLNDIPNLSVVDKLDSILYILSLSITKVDILNTLADFPEDWRLYMLSMIYWLEVATTNITKSHLYSLILCAILLKFVDTKIGAVRTAAKLRGKYAILFDSTIKCMATESDALQDIFSKITKEESVFTMSSLLVNFSLSDKIARNNKQFDIRIVNAFAQLQCCHFYISALNSLLDAPLAKLVISDFYNGTFVYNMVTNLDKRTDIPVYLKQLLEKSPTVFYACERFVELLSKFTMVRFEKETKKTKRKKATKKKQEAKEINAIVNKMEEIFIDENNAYSILNCVDQ